MNYLKRAFCLIVCCAILAGITAANAATTEFTDTAAIVNKTAVETVTGLGLMSADKDGFFNPEGKLTRAEMCKIICLIKNGGDDPLLNSILVRVPFSDVKDHWAVYYIAYSKDLGAVAGDGDDTFNPDSYLTATQAAKMLLTALGYDAKIANFVGEDWAFKTSVTANQKKLYEGLIINVSLAISRDNAAQMINNALNAVIVEYQTLLYMENGELKGISKVIDNKQGETLLSKNFKIKT